MRKRILYPVMIMVMFLLSGITYGLSAKSTNGAPLAATATIYGSDTEVCTGDSVEATIYFTGDGPWDVKINDNDGTYLELKDVEESSITIWLVPLEDNRYYIKEVKDKRGKRGDTFGEVIISVYDPTPVTIQLEKTAYLKSDPGVVLLSSPSGAVFSGNGISGNVFYPGIAGPADSPHRVVCTYTNKYGCISTDDIDIHVLYGEGEVQLLSGNDPINVLCDNGETYLIRGSNLDNIPGLFELREAGSQDPVQGHISDKDLNDDEAILDPTGLAGPYDIIYSYEFQSLTVNLSYRFEVTDLGLKGMTGLPDVVCQNDDPYHLMPDLVETDPGAVYLFSGPGVSGNQADGYYYDPGALDAPQGENQITLEYNASNGCSSILTRMVTNRFAPNVQFSLTPVCLPEDGGLVTFKNLTSGKDEVDSWSWDFGDPSSGANNYSSLEDPEHFYRQVGSRQITLTATTTAGCVANRLLDTVLTDRPVADFTWINDCYVEGQKVAFVNRSISTFASLDTLIWTFKTTNDEVLGVIGSSSPADTVEFSFASLDNYLINLQIRNEVGCGGDATKEIILKPIRILTAEGYEEDFNGEKTDWISDSDGQYLSWRRDVPDFTGFNQVPGDWAWFTDLPPDNSGYLEHSWIQSTCFDFSRMGSSIFKMDLMKSFKPEMDGAVLQYQDMVSEGWKTIGNVEEGINWYNATELFNKPGGSSFGWGLDPFNPDRVWVNSSHDLDMVAGLSHVKFRVAIATGGTEEIEEGRYNQGFAFDNIFIGERIRRSLLEYFTNSASIVCKEADDVVDNFAKSNPGSVIDLQYHVDYPGVDPMNVNNPYPPSTRSFKYGVQGVPFAVLNGGTRPEHRFDFSDPSNEPNDDVLKQASFEIPVFDMDLSVNWLDNSMEATTLITCRTDTFNSNLQLYVVLLESLVTAYPGLNQDTMFRNVVLDILPTPAGKLLGNEWYNGKTDLKSYLWDYKEYVEDIEDLVVVAFIQDRDNEQVLQVASVYHTPLVGNPARQEEARSMAIYPNPAVDRLFVNLGNRHVKSGQLKIMDLTGKLVITADVQPGFSLYQLDVAQLSRGMYMIYWIESGVVKGRNKLVLGR